MPKRHLAIVSTLATLLAGAGMAACGDDGSGRPENAYVRLSEGTGTTKAGRHWTVDGGPATVGWTAHGAAEDDRPTTLRITRLTGSCAVPVDAPCSDDDDSALERGQPEEIELPADGAGRSGTITIGELEPGTRERISVELCREDDCWASALREYRRTE